MTDIERILKSYCSHCAQGTCFGHEKVAKHISKLLLEARAEELQDLEGHALAYSQPTIDRAINNRIDELKKQIGELEK